MVSSGSGEARGLEVFLERTDTGGRWYGQANLSLSRVEHAGLDGVARPGSFEYPAIANVTGTYRMSQRWDVSTRVAYLAGRPYTPFDLETSTLQRRAVNDLARVNAERLPDYFRIDLRVDRRFSVNQRPVSLFAGIQNVTNRRNVAGYSWDRRGNGPTSLEQLGIFPILGLDWSF
jgi:hypothetical protein